MPVRCRTLAIAWAFACTAGSVAAQSPIPAGDSPCQAEAASLDRDMQAARAKGQMLRHRQLADQRTALLARCPSTAPPASRADQVRQLELKVRQLTAELAQAEAELARLKTAP